MAKVSDNQQDCIGSPKTFTKRQICVSLFFLLLLCAGYLYGVFSRTFRFYTTSVGSDTEYETEAWALVPTDRQGPVPVIVYLHGSGGSLQRSGQTLRTIVDQGYAAVGIEYSKRNTEHFHNQTNQLLDWIASQPWARKNAVVWMGFSLGAQRFLYYLANSDRSPAVLIRVAGGTLPELKKQFPRPLSLPVWMVHGENDRIFPLSDVIQLKQQMLKAGASVRLDVLPRKPHGLKHDRGVVIKLLVDRLKKHFSDGKS